ncbi:unnamed protein product [Symbiodinium natans]|uniref:Uncharacterized protein n=1 Tax=Symbiodinium natans TaxID=878477 RepID=A0A812UGW7_9DINO|nr:unnamed protein product [Symbiodinium natans]
MDRRFNAHCLEEYWNAHIHYKANSAAIWANDGWNILQQEGFHGTCLDGGGRFYFTMLGTQFLKADLGICAPPSCTEDDITWRVFPLIFRQFFDYGEEHGLHFAVHYQQYQPLTWDFVASFPFQIRLGLFSLAFLALMGSRPWFYGDTEEAGASWPLPWVLASAVASQEVMLYTRWNMYAWFADNWVPFQAFAWLGSVAMEAFLALQLLVLLRAAAAASREGQAWRAAGLCLRRLCAFCCAAAAFGVLAQGASRLTVNRFSSGMWIQGWLHCLNCCVEPDVRVLLSGGDGCRFFAPLRAGALRALLAAPATLLASWCPSLATALALLGAVLSKDVDVHRSLLGVAGATFVAHVVDNPGMRLDAGCKRIYGEAYGTVRWLPVLFQSFQACQESPGSAHVRLAGCSKAAMAPLTRNKSEHCGCRPSPDRIEA